MKFYAVFVENSFGRWNVVLNNEIEKQCVFQILEDAKECQKDIELNEPTWTTSIFVMTNEVGTDGEFKL